MFVEIANPIYDVVFKYMMKDNAVAKLLISAITGEKIISLESKPQEYPVNKEKSEFPSLTVYRLDFSAHIETPDGYKVVTIEMQKASLPTDVMRFRHYLGEQYTDPDNSTPGDNERKAMQIYCIYFLGKDLGICNTPVLSVLPEIKDVSTGKTVKKRSEFIESLTHKCWIVQISCLKERRRSELEQLLSIFDQSNRTSDWHILNVRAEDFPEKYRPIIRRLKSAASNRAVKKQMQEEDGFLMYMRDWVRAESYQIEQENKELIRQQEEELKVNREELKVNREELKVNREELKVNREELKEKDAVLQEKDRLIAELQTQLKKAKP